MVPSLLLLFPTLLLFSSAAAISIANNLHKPKLSVLDSHFASSAEQPTTYFQVTRPITIPKPSVHCSSLLLQHDFAYTYGKPPVTAPYSPPTNCPSNFPPSLAVLRWSASSAGRQFDRIFGVWLDGVELLRSCTAEPRKSGIIWTVEKDITKYSSLLAKKNSTIAVHLGNLIDDTYTGVYHVNLTLDLYFSTARRNHYHHPSRNLAPGFDSPADLILPISRNLPLNDGLWFLIQNSSDLQSKKLALPSTTYRAVLEIYASFHSDDEFWYTNPPDVYISSNNLTGVPGHGAFREIKAVLDGVTVGSVWPFTVIYTGGVNPLLWRPITGIGSFDLPSYDIEMTPFLGKILDGKPHDLGFGVTNALDVWYIDANLHLWLDTKSSQTFGDLVKYQAPNFDINLESKFDGLDGQFVTTASRQISATGWVKSSFGNITTHFFQTFNYENWMEYSNNGSIQVVNQTTDSNSGIYVKHPSSVMYSEQVYYNFPLYLYSGTSDQVNDSYSFVSNISFAFNEKKFSGEKFGFSFSSLKNLQTGQGVMKVKGNLVTSGLASTQQVYRYESTDGCYYRNVSSSNYTVLHDQSGLSCTKGSPMGHKYFAGVQPSPVRRSYLGSVIIKKGHI